MDTILRNKIAEVVQELKPLAGKLTAKKDRDTLARVIQRLKEASPKNKHKTREIRTELELEETCVPKEDVS